MNKKKETMQERRARIDGLKRLGKEEMQKRLGKIRLGPNAEIGVVNYPKKLSEFEVQAFVYGALLAAGHDVRGEVRARANSTCYYRKAFFDLVIFESKRAALIIEVKDTLGATKGSFQFRKYTSFGIPVKYVLGMEAAKLFVAEYLESGGPGGEHAVKDRIAIPQGAVPVP